MEDESEKRPTSGDLNASDPKMWELTARSLIRAGNLCWERHEKSLKEVIEQNSSPDPEVWYDLQLLGPAFLLAGMGLEALLKALLLRVQPALVSSKGEKFYTHELRKLAEQLPCLALSSEDLHVLEKLGVFVEWAGRYPVPPWYNDKGRAKYDCISVIIGSQETIKASGSPYVSSHDLWYGTTRVTKKVYENYDRMS